MSIWLTESEPTVYSFADLQRDGDEVLYDHTGKDEAVVGIAE